MALTAASCSSDVPATTSFLKQSDEKGNYDIFIYLWMSWKFGQEDIIRSVDATFQSVGNNIYERA